MTNIVRWPQADQCDCDCGPGNITSWGQLQQCWNDTRQFKSFIRTVVESVLDDIGVGGAGITDGSQAGPGMIGEEVTTGAITTTAAGPATQYSLLGSLSLPPGDWIVFGNLYWGSDIPDLQGQWFMITDSGLPMASTDNARPADGVAWFGGSTYANAGGSVGPIRIVNAKPASVDLRGEYIGTSGTGTTYWTLTGTRQR